jgi:hypothetical protein
MQAKFNIHYFYRPRHVLFYPRNQDTRVRYCYHCVLVFSGYSLRIAPDYRLPSQNVSVFSCQYLQMIPGKIRA